MLSRLRKMQFCFSRVFRPFDICLQHNRLHQQKCHCPPNTPGGLSTYCTELFKGYPAVSVLVCVDNGLVHDLLELRVLQVVAYHHLQHLEELAVGDVAVLVHVVDPESDCGAGRGHEGGEEQKRVSVSYKSNKAPNVRELVPDEFISEGHLLG